MSLGLIVHLTDIGTGEGGVGRITNTRNEGDNTPAVSTPPSDQTLAPSKTIVILLCDMIFAFFITILTVEVRSENIIMPFLAPDRSSHILLEKYGYYTWPITVLDQLLATRFFMIIPLFYSRLMLKTISPSQGSQVSAVRARS